MSSKMSATIALLEKLEATDLGSTYTLSYSRDGKKVQVHRRELTELFSSLISPPMPVKELNGWLKRLLTTKGTDATDQRSNATDKEDDRIEESR